MFVAPYRNSFAEISVQCLSVSNHATGEKNQQQQVGITSFVVELDLRIKSFICDQAPVLKQRNSESSD